MSILKLKDIGKIYVSEGTVAVGIRNVNLSFELGEFVAITGESGSGKSTLLNILSGIDTYEEGEMYVDGNPTSHYLQADWEEYRERYISFIFQNYNILESFTVLQNVELALMSIENPKERKRKAIELLERVGMKSHMHQKGSHLSGGQKQRTVIARALAKDSPIILADEPTGNLDQKSSKEIIDLLHEISKDKLVVIVTHNFEEVEQYATREIRVYNGTVGADNVAARETEPVSTEAPKTASEEGGQPETETPKKRQWKQELSNGIALGKAVFCAKPKLTILMSLVMICGLLGIFILTAAFGDFEYIFGDATMFEKEKGRLVLVRKDGQPISDEEVSKLDEQYNPERVIHYDYLKDMELEDSRALLRFAYDPSGNWNFRYTLEYKTDFGKPDYGRYPENNGEVLLYVPIFYRDIYQPEGEESVGTVRLIFESSLPASNYIENPDLLNPDAYPDVLMPDENGNPAAIIRNDADRYKELIARYGNLKICGIKYYYDSGIHPKMIVTEEDFYGLNELELMSKGKDLDEYRQASLFFKNDRTAKKIAKELNEEGYIAVTTKTKRKLSVEEIISLLLTIAISGVMWFLGTLFMTFFVNLCLQKSFQAFRDDISIMRSMGIPVKTIKIGMWVRLIMAEIPALIALPILALVVYRTPKWNCQLIYMRWWHYAIILVGMFLIIRGIMKKQNKLIFEVSVKKSLQGVDEK